MIYMDNGATSYPKPPEVIEALIDATTNYCANPGRSGHFMAARTAQEIYKTRLAIARLFNIKESSRIIFTKNCTESLNLALEGTLREGDHVITSSMEHNSVIRPLKRLESKNITTTCVKCNKDGTIAPHKIRQAINNKTRMIIITAASNVTGTKMPLEEIGRIALRNGIIFAVDGAQGAGHMDLDVRKNHIDILAAPGHKGLMGPQGTGILLVREGITLKPLLAGGTGTLSTQKQQPDDFPEGYEAGTLNSPGIIALGAAVKMINKIGVDIIENHEQRLTGKLHKGLEKIPEVTIYGPEDVREKTSVVAINIEGRDSEEVAAILNDRYGIYVRAGFHCSGMAHETIGTGKTGCVRLCPGFYTGEKEIEATVAAIREICEI